VFANPVLTETTPFKGKVQHLSYNAEGKLAGVILEDKTYIKFHSDVLENSLAGPNSLKVGTEVSGKGQLTLRAPNRVFERVLLESASKKIIDDNRILASAPRPTILPNFKWMKDESQLLAVSTRLDGQID